MTRRRTGSGPDLFTEQGRQDRERAAPLPWRLRPRTLEELEGQEALTGPDGILRVMVEEGRVRPALFYGPPGTGKTSAAEIVARAARQAFVRLSAVEATVTDLRQVVAAARERWELEGRGTVLFIDEIHRFTRVQQDALLPHVEDGTVALIGATSENPWVSVEPALLSRVLPVRFRPLDPAAVAAVLERAWARRAEWLPGEVERDPALPAAIAARAGGDARLALTILERVADRARRRRPPRLTLEDLEQVWQEAPHYHDRAGDAHYDLISAYIKSIRGSDPDAALYWLGRMLAGGEDPRFIVRRILVHAAEDIGLADPLGLVVAQAAWTALEAVGLPEARIPIAMATVYLATAPKSNSVVAALERMDEAVKRHPAAPVPDFLRRPGLGGDGSYRYPHTAPGHFLPDPHLPPELEGLELYQPSAEGAEAAVAERLAAWRAARARDQARRAGPAAATEEEG
ncbi:AAA domain-containing protein [Candidatus Hydrogenisulfobacillus filiaventi]|uniref:AAA domain-containing protein n=1 Tax=Candidatus Hydrogenisulfobacillus filiaventi TaxID=2707344 RepID=A0A6F8ZH93_9FIRM|nr:replication-associated recombination protein A [Bacillota bacterium]CAB1128966.1 AAA domain-containing protein [Candidatus Hydrogenisulfobacillus filiaventi]